MTDTKNDDPGSDLEKLLNQPMTCRETKEFFGDLIDKINPHFPKGTGENIFDDVIKGLKGVPGFKCEKEEETRDSLGSRSGTPATSRGMMSR